MRNFNRFEDTHINIEKEEYWNNRYLNSSDNWTLNNPNPVLVHLFNRKKFSFGKELLNLGAGKGHDSVFVAQSGYNVTSIDISSEAINLGNQLSKLEGVEVNFWKEDIFNLPKYSRRKFDLIYEYVTLCSILPGRRKEFLSSVDSVLADNGYFVTVLFPIQREYDGPPFKIDLFEFLEIAGQKWRLVYFQRNIPSVKPRKGNEVLIIFKKMEKNGEES